MPDQSFDPQQQQVCSEPAAPTSCEPVAPVCAPPGPQTSAMNDLLKVTGDGVVVGQEIPPVTYELNDNGKLVEPAKSNPMSPEELEAARQRDRDHAAENAAHDAEVKKHDAPLEDDEMGNALPGLFLGGVKGLVEGGVKMLLKETGAHAVSEIVDKTPKPK